MPPLIRVIGSLNVDFTTVTPRVPGPGETLTATSLSVNAGGKGANQAVACGRAAFVSKESQDVAVEMIGAVGSGDPYYASLLKPTLEDSGVSTRGVREIEGEKTGTATILVESDAGGENRILVVAGSNESGMKDFELVKEASMTKDGKKVIPEVVVMQGEIPRATVLGLLKHFNQGEIKTKVIFNPAPVFPQGVPPESLKDLAVLVVNETECVLLAKSIQISHQVKDPENMTTADLQVFSSGFHEVGVNTILITLGSKGVFYSSETGNVQDLLPAVKVPKVMDTTAAGDTFVGFFATALARHVAKGDDTQKFDIASAVTKANEAAARCVQRSGAMQSIPFGYE